MKKRSICNTVMMEYRSTFIITACWVLATRPVAECSTSNSQLYQMVTGEDSQALCAATAPSQQVTVKSSAQCMAECLQFPGCTGANFENSTTCQMYNYFPNAFYAQAGCRHYQVRSVLEAVQNWSRGACFLLVIHWSNSLKIKA